MTIANLTQAEFNTIGKEITAVIEQLKSGMITVTEFLDFMTRIKIPPDATAGLICPFTGLAYPTVAETDAFMATVAS